MRGMVVSLIVIGLGWLSAATVGADQTHVQLALDWTPNTNHTGIYVASELGYFADESLEIEIVQPGPTTSIQLTGSGKTAFGVSMQEYVTMARAIGVPVVSIAAVVQHNTSGFAALTEKGIRTAKDFENKRYGGWGQQLEEVMIRTVMAQEEADFDTVTFVNIGTIDAFVAARRDLADFFWIFYGWSGINAKLQGIDFSFLPLIEHAEVLDYYTPVIITNETLIQQDPGLVECFLRALKKGYEYAIENPDEAAAILLSRVPELDEALVVASQRWLSGKYAEDSEVWGMQKQEVWQRFAEWALENQLIDTEIDAERAFTNQFLLAEGEGN